MKELREMWQGGLRTYSVVVGHFKDCCPCTTCSVLVGWADLAEDKDTIQKNIFAGQNFTVCPEVYIFTRKNIQLAGKVTKRLRNESIFTRRKKGADKTGFTDFTIIFPTKISHYTVSTAQRKLDPADACNSHPAESTYSDSGVVQLVLRQ